MTKVTDQSRRHVRNTQPQYEQQYRHEHFIPRDFSVAQDPQHNTSSNKYKIKIKKRQELASL